jgi:nucleoside-diphosphate-sugar epimerase
MRILVTGGSGLVGRYVVKELQSDHDPEILDLRPPASGDVRFHQVDLLDPAALKLTVRDFDAVVHLGGIPHPLNDPADVVFRTNALGTFNLLEACAANRIGKFVFMSSESVLGFAFSTTRMWPQTLPIDEQHPLRPQDSYGLSKVTSEHLCSGFTRRTGMQTICLRPPWIWAPEPKEIAFYRQLRAEFPNWFKNLWAYIHVRDVAGAVRTCIERSDLPPHDSFFIAARGNWTGRESRQLANQFFPETTQIREEFTGSCSFISTKKAETLIGFEPKYTWMDLPL